VREQVERDEARGVCSASICTREAARVDAVLERFEVLGLPSGMISRLQHVAAGRESAAPVK
jgi:hypothetical protein